MHWNFTVLTSRKVVCAPSTSTSLEVERFHVVSGKLLIRNWRHCQGLVDETILGPGDFNAVEPGYYHQFEALEDGLAFELYWAEFNHDDIERETFGFTKDDE